MALTPGAILVATDGNHSADSTLSNTSTTTTVTGADGAAVTPASATLGLSVTFNSDGFGEVDFWNLKNATAGGQGFYFKQKTGASTANVLAALYSEDGITQLDVHGPVDPDNNYIALQIVEGTAAIFAGAGLVVDLTPGYAFANLPSPPDTGSIALILNSSTVTWGATIAAASPGTPVIGWFNGTNWTVIGK